MLEVTFVRKRGQRDHVYVTRDDGSTASWAFPSYGDGLPHDLCHLVVEDGLGLTEGFWGLVDQHVDVGLVDNQATLMRDGKPLAEQPDVDLRGLMQAEAAVAMLGSPLFEVETVGQLAVARVADPAARAELDDDARAALVDRFGADLPDAATPERVTAIRRRLGELGHQWRSLEDGGSIRLTFPTGDLRHP